MHLMKKREKQREQMEQMKQRIAEVWARPGHLRACALRGPPGGLLPLVFRRPQGGLGEPGGRASRWWRDLLCISGNRSQPRQSDL